MPALIAFKSRLDDETLESSLIADVLGSDWIHTEIIFPSRGMVGWSSWRDQDTTFRPFYGRVVKGHWEFYEIPINEQLLWQWCLSKVGKPYDLVSVSFNAVQIPVSNPLGWFCSEAVYDALMTNGGELYVTRPASVMPNELRDFVIQAGWIKTHN